MHIKSPHRQIKHVYCYAAVVARLIGQLFFFSNAESKTSETIQSADEAICHHMGGKNVAIPCGNDLKWENEKNK